MTIFINDIDNNVEANGNTILIKNNHLDIINLLTEILKEHNDRLGLYFLQGNNTYGGVNVIVDSKNVSINDNNIFIIKYELGIIGEINCTRRELTSLDFNLQVKEPTIITTMNPKEIEILDLVYMVGATYCDRKILSKKVNQNIFHKNLEYSYTLEDI